MASRKTHVQLNSQIPLPSSPPHPRTPHLCLLDPCISNPKVTANSTHHQPNSWALSQDILRRVGATCLSSHSKQVAGARCKPSTAQVHLCPGTGSLSHAVCHTKSVGQTTWEGSLDVFLLWCPLLLCSIWESGASFWKVLVSGKKPNADDFFPEAFTLQTSALMHDSRWQKDSFSGSTGWPSPYYRCSSIV